MTIVRSFATWLLIACLALAAPAAAQLTMVGVGPGGASGGSPPAVPAYVQGNSCVGCTVGSTTDVSVTMTAAVSNGSLLVVTACGVFTGVTAVFTDDKGNAYTNWSGTITSAGAGYSCAQGYKANITNAPQTITATFSGLGSFLSIVADEWSNVAASPADGAGAGQAQASPSGTNSVTSGNFTTTSSGDLIYGFAVSIASTGMSFGTTLGFTGRLAVSNTFYTEDLIQASPGTTACAFTPTSSSDLTIATCFAFKHS